MFEFFYTGMLFDKSCKFIICAGMEPVMITIIIISLDKNNMFI